MAPDRNRNLSLDVFILSMIDHGVTTTYQLQEAARLSLGATKPALDRLQKAGLVTYSVSDRRHEYSLTEQGRHKLETGWEKDLDRRVPKELEAILRDAYLRWLLGDPRQVSRLREAIKARRRFAQDRQTAAEHLLKSISQTSPDVDVFGWMKAASEAERAAAEASALKRIAHVLERRPPVKSTNRADS